MRVMRKNMVIVWVTPSNGRGVDKVLTSADSQAPSRRLALVRFR